jgi:uncharacterized membrane protein YkvA (DUF1232 family)
MLKLRHVCTGERAVQFLPCGVRICKKDEVEMSDERKPVIASPNALTQTVRTARLVWRLFKDPRISFLPKLIPVAGLAYVISPIDLIPDFILGLGQLDDIGIVLLAIALFIEFCPRAIVDAHRAALDAEMGVPHANDDTVVDGTYRVVDDDAPRKD